MQYKVLNFTINYYFIISTGKSVGPGNLTPYKGVAELLFFKKQLVLDSNSND